jgi:hypothetical protein
MANKQQIQLNAAASALDLFEVTPDDTDPVRAGVVFRGLLIETAGTLRLTVPGGPDGGPTVRDYPSGLFAPNVVHPLAFTHVHATGTTAVVWAAE